MEVMYSERGKKLLVYAGYKFYKDRVTGKGWKWRCTVRKCLAKLYVDNSALVILESDLCHNHDCDELLSRQMISNSVKRKATHDISERPLKLIRKEICNVPAHHSGDITVRDVGYIRKNLYRARRKTLPPLPRSIADVHTALNGLTITSNRNEDMLQINDNVRNLVCFSTNSNLQYLCKRDKIFVDGTFSCSPKFFYQLFTIHCVENGHYVPLVFFLLPNKTIETYQNMFQMLNERCVTLNPNFLPRIIVADFESAIHRAAQSIWPECIIVGCRFHLTQAWWRKIQQLGLAIEYKDANSDIGQWLRWIFGLPFLDAREVGDSFVEDFMSEQPNDDRVIQFSDYLTDNYITEHAKFPPALWASSSITSERTTNACESFHSRFNGSFLVPHPNIFIFIDVMKQIQVDVYTELNSLQEEKKITNLRYKKASEIVKKFLQEYETGLISRFHFVKCVAYHYKK